MLFTEVTGNRVGDNYARNIYIKVSIKITVLCILLAPKILHQNNKVVLNYRTAFIELRPEVITVFTIKHALPMLVLL